MFSKTSSTDNGNGIENKLNNFSLALKSKSLKQNSNFNADIFQNIFLYL